jgi:hypothetical protein
MTIIRLLSPSLRSGVEIALGAALIVLPLALGLSAAAIVAGVAVGALAASLGVSGTAPEGRGTIPLSALAAYDRGLALGLLAAATLFALDGHPGAAAFFGAAGAIQLTLCATTRYSVARA